MDEALSKALRELERVDVSPFFRFRTGSQGDISAIIDLRNVIVLRRQRNTIVYITLTNRDDVQVHPLDLNDCDYNKFYQELENRWMATKIRYG